MTSTTHHGDLIITYGDGSEYAHITVVTGNVRASDSAQVTLPALTKCMYVVAYDRAYVMLPALTECGNVRVYDRAQVTLTALAECGDVRVYNRAQVTLPLVGATIASDGVYQLFRKHCGTYHAGCRQGLTAEQALEYLHREYEHEKLFTAAIRKAEGMEK